MRKNDQNCRIRFEYVSFGFSYGELYFSRIKLSNLMLVVVPVNDDPGEPIGAEAKRINYAYSGNNTFPCHKRALNNLPHRRLDDCFTENCRVSKTANHLY